MGLVLSERIEKVSYEIRDIMVRAKKVQATGKKIHWFNIGDPNQFGFRPPKHVTKAIMAALREPKYSAYCPSEGDPELREAAGRIEGVPVNLGQRNVQELPLPRFARRLPCAARRLDGAASRGDGKALQPKA